MNNKTSPVTADSIVQRLAEWSRADRETATGSELLDRGEQLGMIIVAALEWEAMPLVAPDTLKNLTTGQILAWILRIGLTGPWNSDDNRQRVQIYMAIRLKVASFARADDGFGDDWIDEMKQFPPDVAWNIACEIGKERDRLKETTASCLTCIEWVVGQMEGDTGTGASYWQQFQQYRAMKHILTQSRQGL